MGCGGSKEDVAPGNPLTRRPLRKASSAITSKSSSTEAATSIKEASAATDAASNTATKDQTSSEDSSEEYFSSGREMEGLWDRSEGATGYYSPSAQVIAEGHAVEPAEESGELEEETSEAEKEDEQMISNKDDEGESIGQHSVDFKETISVIEEEEAGGEFIILENKDSFSEAPAEILKEPRPN